MPSSLNLSGWAGDIISSMEISGATTGIVVSWLENNVGNLNLTLKESFYLSGSGIYSGESAPTGMSINSMAIYTQMYECYYLSKEARRASYLGYDDWLEINGEDQGSIRKVSKSEISKNFLAQTKECRENLNKLVDWYVNEGGNGSGISRLPLQVIPGYSYSCTVPLQYLSASNCCLGF